MSKRQVPVFEKDVRIKAYVNNSLEVKEVGVVQTRRYEGEDVFKNSFRPMLELDSKNMKPTSKEWIPLQHTEVIDPLLEEGWEMKSTSFRKEGRIMSAVMTHPEGDRFKDPFTYDKGTWGNTDADGNDGLIQSLFIKHQILPSRGIVGVNGFFRFICANGIVDSALELGKVRMTHNTWDPEEYVRQLTSETLTEDLILGEKIGTKEALKRYVGFVEDYRQMDDFESYRDQLPVVARPYATAIEKLPEWLLVGINQDLSKLATSRVQNLHRGHIINSVTNAMNLGLQDDDTRSRGAAESKIDTFINSASTLIGHYSL